MCVHDPRTVTMAVGFGPVQLQRPKRDLIEHGGIKELCFGVLKNQGYATAQIKGKGVIMKSLFRAVNGFPQNEIVPLEEKASPASKRSNVDLPEPLAPRTAMRSPFPMSSVTFSRALTSEY